MLRKRGIQVSRDFESVYEAYLAHVDPFVRQRLQVELRVVRYDHVVGIGKERLQHFFYGFERIAERDVVLRDMVGSHSVDRNRNRRPEQRFITCWKQQVRRVVMQHGQLYYASILYVGSLGIQEYEHVIL